MEAVSQEGFQQFGTAVGQASYYVGFSTTPTNAATRVNNHHYSNDYAFRHEAESATEWHEVIIQYTGPDSVSTMNANLESPFIFMVPKVMI